MRWFVVSGQWSVMKKVRRGFTLVELLLVLVILAVLAAVVVPRFTGKTDDARKTAAKTQIASFRSGLRSFELDCGRFPTNEEGLGALLDAPGNAKGWKGPYLETNNIPNDPWGQPYKYQYPANKATKIGYDVYSVGPNGQDGDDDDIGNWQD